MKFHEDNQPTALYLTVPNEISATGVGSIISYLWSVEAYSVINQSQNEENTNFEIVLQDQHKSMTLHEYISKIRSYVGISVEVFKFFCQYGVNIDALKQAITSVSEPVLFNEILKHIEEGNDSLSSNCYFLLKNPLPESIEKLLKCGVDANHLFRSLQINNKNTDKELHLQNLGIVTQDPNFKWDDIPLMGKELDVIEELVYNCNMPISKALRSVHSYKVDGKGVNNNEARGRYEEFVILMYQEAKKREEKLDGVYLDFKGFSINALHLLLDNGMKEYDVFSEVFRQITEIKEEGCAERIEFLNKNQAKVEWHCIHNLHPNIDILTQLIVKGGMPIGNALNEVFNQVMNAKKLSDEQVSFILKHQTDINWKSISIWGFEIDVLERLIDSCGMPAQYVLEHASQRIINYKVSGESGDEEHRRYEKFIISLCNKIKENGGGLESIYFHLDGYSLGALQELLDADVSCSYIFSEIFHQIKKGGDEISESHIGFLQKNKDKNKDNLVNSLRSLLISPDMISLEVLLQLHDKQIISSEELALLTGCYTYSYYGHQEHQVCHKSLDYDALQRVIHIAGIDTFRSQFEKLLLEYVPYWLDDIVYKNLPSLEIMKHFYEKKLIDANLLFLYGASVDNLEIMEQACKDGADLTYTLYDDNSLFSHMIENASYRSINVILSEHNIKIASKDIMSLPGRFKFAEGAHIFSKIYYEGIINEALDFARDYGVLPAKADLIKIILHFQLQYSSLLKDLSNNELLILSDREVVLLSDLNKSDELKNPAGFNLLQLAVLANRFDLVLEIIKENPTSINELPPNGINFFILWELFGSRWSQIEVEKKIDEINQEILKHAKNVDFDTGTGETIADLLIENAVSIQKVLDVSKDPLFDLFKSDDISKTVNSFSQDGKIHIAITHYFKHCYESLWDTGMLSSIRALGQNHQDIQFHLITQQNIEVGGDSLLKIFDGIIMPSGENETPHMSEYSNAFSESYYKIITKADEWGIPLFAMLSGMLNLVIHNGGEVHKVKGYDCKIHDITFIPGTLPYFMSLDPAMQNDILAKKEGLQLPRVSYKHKIQGYFTAITDKLGTNIELSATSEDGEAMACSSGIQIATQYYPKYNFGINDSQTNNDHTNNLLDSYIRLVIRNHLHKKGIEEIGPIEYAKMAIAAMQNYLPYEHLANEEEIYIAGDNVEN